jgi:hypothetical protein
MIAKSCCHGYQNMPRPIVKLTPFCKNDYHIIIDDKMMKELLFTQTQQGLGGELKYLGLKHF